MRLVMQCTIASPKLYKEKRRRRKKNSYFSITLCAYLVQNAPRLQGPRRQSVDNVAIVTERNHWQLKRDSPKNQKAMQSRTKWGRVYTTKGRKQKGKAI